MACLLRRLAPLAVCFFACSLFGQTTAVTATITDTNAQPWVGASFRIDFQPAPGTNPNSYIWQGLPFPQSQRQFSGTLDGTGTFTATIPDSLTISPALSTWKFTICPLASTTTCQVVSLTVTGASVNLSSTLSAGLAPPAIFPTPLNFAYQNGNVQPTPGLGQLYYNSATLGTFQWNGAAWVPFGGGGGGGVTGAWIDVNKTLGCDPTGVADCTAALLASIATNPNATYMFGVPAGSSSATYLLAATANVTIPYGITLQFQNGAVIATGHQAASNITAMNRVTAVSGTIPGVTDTPETISLAGCTSSSVAGTTATAASETFTNCPNTLLATVSNVYLTGLTNVANCYTQCLVSTATATGFTIANPASTVVASGPETGSLVKTLHTATLFLSASGVTSSSGSGSITLNVPNPLSYSGATSAIGRPIGLVGTTHVPAGNYLITGGSSSIITLSCPACSTVSSGAETGTASYTPGGTDTVTFATSLAGSSGFTPGIYIPGNRVFNIGLNGGLTQIVCSGTGGDTDGPYWINSFLSTTSMALLDARMGTPQVTTGSCYLPYILTVQGSVVAATAQQIVANGSAVTFAVADPIYVGWYGAKGAVLAADDYLPFQEALFWNPGRHVAAPITQPATYNFDVARTPDYNINDSLQLYGNSQSFDGLQPDLWDGGTVVGCGGPGPCVILRADIATPTVQNFHFYAEPQVCGGTGAVLSQLTFMDKDAIYVGAGESHLKNIGTRCFPRNGITFISLGGFNNIVSGGSPQPDYWQADRLWSDSDGGYGIAALGHDSNAGQVSGTNNAFANVYGGYWDVAQESATYISPNGEDNSQSVAAGTPSTVTSLTVTGSGLNAMCTIAPFPATTTNWWTAWITVSGTNGSGGAAGTDGTWWTGRANPYPCPGASGGPATTGTVSTAASNDIYNQIQNYASGSYGARWVIAGLVNGGNQITINPYSESTNGCITSSGGLILGGTMGEFLYQNGGANNCGTSKTYGTGIGLGAYVGSGFEAGLNVFSNGGLYLRSITSTSNIAQSFFNAAWNGAGTAFSGFMGNLYSTNVDQNLQDWREGVVNGDKFELVDSVTPDSGKIVLEVDPSTNGNQTVLSGPSTTAPVILGTGATSTSPSGFCANGLWSFTGDENIKFCKSTAWTTYGPIVATLTTTAATSDNLTVTGMTSTGHCTFGQTNASAATNIATTYISAKTTNQITVTHVATSGMTYDFICTAN